MQLVVIEAEYVDVHCYLGPKQQVQTTLQDIDINKSQESKIVKIVFYLTNLTVSEYT